MELLLWMEWCCLLVLHQARFEPVHQALRLKEIGFGFRSLRFTHVELVELSCSNT